MNRYTTEKVSEEYIAINSCGRQQLFRIDTGSCRPNGRVDYHILYIAEGKCYVQVGDETKEAEAGSLIVFLPRQPQDYKFYKKDRAVSYYIHFSGTACHRLLKELGLDQSTVSFIGKSHSLEVILDNLVSEYRQKYKYHNYRMNGLLLDALAVMGRNKSNMTYGDTEAGRKFGEVCKYIADNYAENISVKALADMCNLSESRFSHRFTELIGVSPKRYLLEYRMESARELLTSSDLSIREISEEVGISDQNYFSRSFKKYCGLSPNEYRRKY